MQNSSDSTNKANPPATKTPSSPTTPLKAGQKRSFSPSSSAASPAFKKTTPATSTKYYAVRTGRNPGIYYTWNDCKRQVGGYKGARYKAFTTLQDADAFVRDDGMLAPLLSSPAQPAATTPKREDKFYAVRIGKKPGVYIHWADVKIQIKGVKNPKYRKFDTREAAENFVMYGNPNGPPDSKVSQPQLTKDEGRKEIAADEDSLLEGVVDESDTNVIADPVSGDVRKTPEQHGETQLRQSEDEDTLIIYTDGSSLSNGRVGAQAGVGVFFGPGDERNVSEPLEGIRQTNQRAELTAILRALEIAPRSRGVRIITDSQYSIKCVTVWFQKWRSNGWKNAANKPVENKDLISTIIDRIEERDSLGSKTLFEWVKGHNNDPGNVAADQLAVNGARRVLQESEGAGADTA